MESMRTSQHSYGLSATFTCCRLTAFHELIYQKGGTGSGREGRSVSNDSDLWTRFYYTQESHMAFYYEHGSRRSVH